MFRKKPKLQSSPPPEPPSTEEILEDLETFHIPKKFQHRARELSDNSNLEEWWPVFETFLLDLNDLKDCKTNMNGNRISLEASQLEIETLGKNIENDIEENLQKTKSVVFPEI